MRTGLVFLFGGLLLSALSAATASDAISLRDVCHALPVLGEMVNGLRLGMGTPLAHMLEPAVGMLGGGLTLLALRVVPARPIRALVPVRA